MCEGRGSELRKGRACCPLLGHLAPVWLNERVLVSLSFLGVGDETIPSQSPLDPEQFRPFPISELQRAVATRTRSTKLGDYETN